MNILLDTEELIWALNADPRLSKKAAAYITEPDNDIYYSAVSILEVSVKHAADPENVSFSGRELASYCSLSGFFSLPLQDRHIFAMESLKRQAGSPAHSDLFDRLLVGQAKAENMLFLTHNKLLSGYSEKCVIFV